MARPPTGSSVRPRSTARSFSKPSSDNMAETALHPHPTPPYSSAEFGMCPQPYLLAPPHVPAQHSQPPAGVSVTPQQLLNRNESYFGYPRPYPATQYIPRQYYPPTPSLVNQSGSAQPSESESPSTPVPLQGELPSETEGGPSTLSPKDHTPRPPNAWILYRSDMLRTIAAGGEVPGLEAVMSELGVSAPGTSESSSEDKGNGTEEVKPKKPKKGKKGAKEPTEGLLSLGRGKTGRGLPQADISKMISMLWKRESPEVRGEYERRSETKKKEHAAMYPDYKFQPLRKADKIRKREEKEREKEAARREKELLKSGGGRRRTRTRNRLSPTSPYSVLNPDGTRMARTLNYSCPGEHDFTLGGSLTGTPHDPQDRFRSYPFPMPQSSLPALRPDGMVVPYEATFDSYLPPQQLMSYAQTFQPEQPPTPQQSLPLTAPPSQPGSGFGSPLPNPPGHGDPPEPIDPALALEPEEVHEMAELWSKIDSAPPPMLPGGRGYTQENYLLEYQAVRELVGEDGITLPYAEGDHSTFAEVELRHIQPGGFEGGWIQYAEQYPPADYSFVPFVEDADGVVYATEQALVSVEEVAWHDAMFDFTNTSGDSPLVIGDGPLIPMEAVVIEDNGPFLVEQAVFSPEPEALRPGETNSHPGRPTEGVRVPSGTYTLPRHVSNSAFPATPQSNSPGAANWNDRATSFAFANSFAAPLGAGFTAEDVLGWEDLSSPQGQSRQPSRSGDDLSSLSSMPSVSAASPVNRTPEERTEAIKE